MTSKTLTYILIGLVLSIFSSCSKDSTSPDDNEIVTPPTASTVKDVDGNTYKTVVIGTQTWMAENLKTTKYLDGTTITNITDAPKWNSAITGAYCWYENNTGNKDIYGGLYNGYTINSNKLCPIGWHMPTDAEWDVLSGYLGGTSLSGGKLKELGTTHWKSPNYGANNDAGFTALPGGARVEAGFMSGGNSKSESEAFWWSSTVYLTNMHYIRSVNYRQAAISKSGGNPADGYSVRCVKD